MSQIILRAINIIVLISLGMILTYIMKLLVDGIFSPSPAWAEYAWGRQAAQPAVALFVIARCWEDDHDIMTQLL